MQYLHPKMKLLRGEMLYIHFPHPHLPIHLGDDKPATLTSIGYWQKNEFWIMCANPTERGKALHPLVRSVTLTFDRAFLWWCGISDCQGNSELHAVYLWKELLFYCCTMYSYSVVHIDYCCVWHWIILIFRLISELAAEPRLSLCQRGS